MPMMNPDRAVRGLKQTLLVLEHVLRGMTQEKAASATDGPNGWSIIAVLCHLSDYDEIYYQRAQAIVSQDRPTVATYNADELAAKNDYMHQDFQATLKKFIEGRQRLIEWLSARSEADWQRKGIHPTMGEFDLLEQVTFIAHHDVNHIEQIAHTLDVA